MNKLLVTMATAGLLLTAPAIAQNTNTNQGQNTPGAASQQGSQSNMGSQSGGSAGRLQNDQSGSNQGQRAQRNRGEHTAVSGNSNERREGRERFSTGGRSTTGVRIHEREEFRHRRGFHVRVGGECRTIVVRERHHHHVVVRHIRRCR
jgi:hypothetical protein